MGLSKAHQLIKLHSALDNAHQCFGFPLAGFWVRLLFADALQEAFDAFSLPSQRWVEFCKPMSNPVVSIYEWWH